MRDKRLKQLALNIKAERCRKELTQSELAWEIGVSMTTISQIEQARQTPSAFILYDIANVLDISVNELYKNIPQRDKD